jgi:integrase/recombinase XerD
VAKTPLDPGDQALLDSFDLASHDRAQSTRRLYREILEAFCRWLPEGVTLAEVTKQDVQACFTDLQRQGKAAATIRSRWICLKSFFKWMAGEGEIKQDPMEGIAVSRANPPPVTIPADADLALLLKACSGQAFAERRDLALIRTVAATGARISEVLGLEVSDVDLRTRVLLIRHGKGDRSRVTRIDPETASALDRYLRVRSRHRLAALPQLFTTRFGPLLRGGSSAMLTRRCNQAGIAPIGWHALRHRFAHQFLSRGGDEGALAQLGGWSDPSVMRRYGASLAVDRALSTYDEIGGVVGPRPTRR